MHVETHRSGPELLALAGAGLTLLAGVLPWVAGGRTAIRVAAAVTVLCGLGAGAVLLYGRGDARDDAALLGLGLTVTVVAVRAHGRITGGGLTGLHREAGIGVFVAVLAGLALTAAAGRECWRAVSVDDAPRRGSAGTD